VDAFMRETTWMIEKERWDPAQTRRVDVLARAKYGTDAWNRKR
jgi:hypothetical protein